ncbi:hypothetical protein SLEP1_g56499 [Rubroshorea leprosula]|uniref:Pentatricopeptide repeat-containing protein n=1 Tax=Rubroshorea leprosula TaxID=152421 RepID=A0AAV5MLV4_9ROSI|nr:hypothetical protein SLEP1_g56499 [Rubroshorea leprosula]
MQLSIHLITFFSNAQQPVNANKFIIRSSLAKLFDTSPFEHTSNLLLWNSILRANVSHGYYATALKIYVKMRK